MRTSVMAYEVNILWSHSGHIFAHPDFDLHLLDQSPCLWLVAKCISSSVEHKTNVLSFCRWPSRLLLPDLFFFIQSQLFSCKFQRVSRLGSVTARHSNSGRQPNFAACPTWCGFRVALQGQKKIWTFQKPHLWQTKIWLFISHASVTNKTNRCFHSVHLPRWHYIHWSALKVIAIVQTVKLCNCISLHVSSLNNYHGCCDGMWWCNSICLKFALNFIRILLISSHRSNRLGA